MGVSYSDIENKQNADAGRQQADYNARSNINARQIANQIAIAVDQATSPVKAGANQQIAALPGQYQKLYDANAVQDAVARQLLQQEAGGGADAALNRTQSAALTAQRGSADTDAMRQQRTASQNLSDTLQALLADAAAGKTQQQAAAHYQAAVDQAGFQTDLNQLTTQKILNLYSDALQQQLNTDKLAEQKRQQEAQLQESARQADADNQYNYNTLDFQKQHDLREEQYQKQLAEKQKQKEEEAQKQLLDALKKNNYGSSSGSESQQSQQDKQTTAANEQNYIWPSEEQKEKAELALGNDVDILLKTKFNLPYKADTSVFSNDARDASHVENIKIILDKGEISKRQAAMSIIATIIKNSPEYQKCKLDGINFIPPQEAITVARIGVALRLDNLMSEASDFYDPDMHCWVLPQVAN